MVLFSPDFKVDKGSVFYLKSCTGNNMLFILPVKMADKGAPLNLARKKNKRKKHKHNEARVTNFNAKN